MVKVNEKFVRLTNASVQADIRKERIHLKNDSDLRVSFDTGHDTAKAIYTHHLSSPDGAVDISVKFEGYYEITGMTSEDQAGDLHYACYDEIFKHASKWIADQAQAVGIPDIQIPKEKKGAVKVEKKAATA